MPRLTYKGFVAEYGRVLQLGIYWAELDEEETCYLWQAASLELLKQNMIDIVDAVISMDTICHIEPLPTSV